MSSPYFDFEGELMREMQREKLRLHRFLNNRENSKKRQEEQELKAKEMILKKELKFKRV